jgi:hypothetical protein
MHPPIVRPFASRVAGLLLVAGAAIAPQGASPAPAADGGVFRVESEIYVDDAPEPVARSVTLFREGVAWDFLDRSAKGVRGGAGDIERQDIVLHDPAHERVVLIDPRRNVKTRIDAIRLERLGASLSSWARKSEDRLVRWSGGPDFGEGMRETKDRLELVGPRVRYDVELAAAPAPEIARRYRQFADTAILLKALVNPGGLTPFPRLAINRRIEAAGAVPAAVALEIDARGFPRSTRTDRVRSVHRLHPRLLSTDLDLVEEAEARVAVAREVDLAEFVGPQDAPAE